MTKLIKYWKLKRTPLCWKLSLQTSKQCRLRIITKFLIYKNLEILRNINLAAEFFLFLLLNTFLRMYEPCDLIIWHFFVVFGSRYVLYVSVFYFALNLTRYIRKIRYKFPTTYYLYMWRVLIFDILMQGISAIGNV